MSYKVSLIKMAVKYTPISLILWIANSKLKGIVQIQALQIDLDARIVAVQLQLAGEPSAIDLQFNDFAILSNEQGYQFILHNAQSNKLWLNNLLAFVVGKAWAIPSIPQLRSHMALLAELLKANSALTHAI